MSNGVTGDELLSLAVLGALVLASPPIYYILLFRPKKFLALQIRFCQRLSKFERKPGEEWPAVKIDPWPSSLFRLFLGAPSADVFLNAADETERFPRAINQVRTRGQILFVMWRILTRAAFCGLFLMTSEQALYEKIPFAGNAPGPGPVRSPAATVMLRTRT